MSEKEERGTSGGGDRSGHELETLAAVAARAFRDQFTHVVVCVAYGR